MFHAGDSRALGLSVTLFLFLTASFLFYKDVIGKYHLQYHFDCSDENVLALSLHCSKCRIQYWQHASLHAVLYGSAGKDLIYVLDLHCFISQNSHFASIGKPLGLLRQLFGRVLAPDETYDCDWATSLLRSEVFTPELFLLLKRPLH